MCYLNSQKVLDSVNKYTFYHEKIAKMKNEEKPSVIYNNTE